MTIRYFQTNRELDEELENQMEALEEKSRLQLRLKSVNEQLGEAYLKLEDAAKKADSGLQGLIRVLERQSAALGDEINNMGV